VKPPPSITRADFDRIARASRHRPAARLARSHERFLLRQLPYRARTALDLGCGAGYLTSLLAARVDHVTGIDLSPEMIATARRTCADRGNVELLLADFMTWRPSTTFDAIVSVNTLHHLPLPAALALLRDRLAPGGVLVIIDLYRPTTLRDHAADAISLPLSFAARLLRRDHPAQTAAEHAAWTQHEQHDRFSSLRELRTSATDLGGARIRRHLFWRHSLVWRAPRKA
jgi:SAM-dependent methyltransferase